MHFPSGFKQPGKVLKLLKALYGLHESGRLWYFHLAKQLATINFFPLKSDPTIFLNLDTGEMLGVYVDDMVILTKDAQTCKGLKEKLGHSSLCHFMTCPMASWASS